ncbi:MAG: helix-turn-helix domain-containing protein, partial [bacterium]|nr:helix-turn-helix domain-containing protein [bacterium]
MAKRVVCDKRSLVKIGQASKILGVSIDTLRRWEKTGKITSLKTPGRTRLYALTALRKTTSAGEKPPSPPFKQREPLSPAVKPVHRLLEEANSLKKLDQNTSLVETIIQNSQEKFEAETPFKNTVFPLENPLKPDLAQTYHQG